MNNEELLKPRYKVIADYPHNPWLIGRILQEVTPGLWDCKESRTSQSINRPDKFPANFKKLEWWEEREPGQMPEYVKDRDGRCFKVNSWRIEDGAFMFDDGPASLRYKLPATLAEYEQYINQKEKQ